MNDFYEIDFLKVGSSKSGDAIAIRYRLNDVTYVHVVDGGYQDTGPELVNHIRKYYDNPTYIDHVVVTHPDGDHAGGLQSILEEFNVGRLWMLRPWVYADEIIDRFSRFTSVENLQKRLKEIYPSIAALEKIAVKEGIDFGEPFQGSFIGAFNVIAPTKERYLDLVVQSEKTPESAQGEQVRLGALAGLLEKAVTAVTEFVRSAWGEEIFSVEETSAENDMSVIQFADLCAKKILLTGDAGRSALNEAADFAPQIGLALPGIDRIQVPHHGSRRNVSTEVLDRWLGPRRRNPPAKGEESYWAIVSAAKGDDDHPRKSVVRAFIHRGGSFASTKNESIRAGQNAPERDGWHAVAPLSYPEDQEGE